MLNNAVKNLHRAITGMHGSREDTKEASTLFHNIMKASVKSPKQFRLERIYKEVQQIQSLYKNEIAGELTDYFRISTDSSSYWIDWFKEPPLKVKNAVLDAAYKFIV